MKIVGPGNLDLDLERSHALKSNSKVRFNLNLLLLLLPFPQPIRRRNNNLRLQQQLLMILILLLLIQPRLRLLRQRQQQHGQQILRLRLRHRPQTFIPAFPKHPRGAALDERDAGQFQQVGFRARFQPVDHVFQSGFQHAPAHFGAEVDHAGCETFAGLREGLHEAPGDLEFARDEVDGGFVAEVAELEGGVEAAVDEGGAEF